MQLFHFFLIPAKRDLQTLVLSSVPKCPTAVLERLLRFRNHLLDLANDPGSALWVDSGTEIEDLDEDTDVASSRETAFSSAAVTLSLRQILRISRYRENYSFFVLNQSEDEQQWLQIFCQ